LYRLVADGISEKSSSPLTDGIKTSYYDEDASAAASFSDKGGPAFVLLGGKVQAGQLKIHMRPAVVPKISCLMPRIALVEATFLTGKQMEAMRNSAMNPSQGWRKSYTRWNVMMGLGRGRHATRPRIHGTCPKLEQYRQLILV
jgi:hypothetical protein